MVGEDYRHDCGYNFPVWRPAGRRKEKNHKKWLYCPFCGKMDNFIKAQAFTN